MFANRTSFLLAAIALSLLPAFSAAVEFPGWFKQGLPNLEKELAASRAANKRLVVIFHQEHCSYCQALVDRNLSQRSIESLMREKFDVVAVDIWSDRAMAGINGERHTEKSLAASYGVQFTPTMLFLDEEGKIALRLNGYLAPPRFRAALEYVAQRKEGEISFRDYLQPLQNAGSGSLPPENFLKSGLVDLSRRGSGNRRPIAIFFEQSDCQECEALHAGVLTRDEIRELLGKFDAVQLDLWSSDPIGTPQGKRMSVREWGKKLDIRYAPTVVLMDATGKEIIRADEHFKGFHAPTMLDYVSSGAYRTEPNYQRYLAARAARKRKLSLESH